MCVCVPNLCVAARTRRRASSHLRQWLSKAASRDLQRSLKSIPGAQEAILGTLASHTATKHTVEEIK